MIIRELPKTRRSQKRLRALILLAWSITLGICLALAIGHATPTSGPAWSELAVMTVATFVTWRIVKEVK